MSDKKCRETCEVYADWLKSGEKITELQASNEQYLAQSEELTLDNIARKKEIFMLKSCIEINAGKVCSLKNESDAFRLQAEEAETELEWWRELVHRHHKNFERSNLKEIVQSFIDRAEEAETELEMLHAEMHGTD